MDGGIGVFPNGGTTPPEALEFQGEPGLLLCDGKVGIPLLTKQGNHYLEWRRGKRGSP